MINLFYNIYFYLYYHFLRFEVAQLKKIAHLDWL